MIETYKILEMLHRVDVQRMFLFIPEFRTMGYSAKLSNHPKDVFICQWLMSLCSLQRAMQNNLCIFVRQR